MLKPNGGILKKIRAAGKHFAAALISLFVFNGRFLAQTRFLDMSIRKELVSRSVHGDDSCFHDIGVVGDL